MEDKLEKAFGDFIDRREYDEASNAMLALTRSAFIAGWKAAGGCAGAAGREDALDECVFSEAVCGCGRCADSYFG